ncbi:YjbH domain-containing protein [Roseomonas sp. F4]
MPVTALAQEVAGTGSSFGGVGLVEVRNARFRLDGGVEAGGAWRRDRRFHFVNWQALPWLETGLRVAERVEAPGGGMVAAQAWDVKLRLVAEGDGWPAVALGVQEAFGGRGYQGEYLVASKRFGPWDVTLGLGWGRLGTGGDVGSPLAGVPGFRDGETAAFGGVEYSLPEVGTPWGEVGGFRAKVEYAGDAWRDGRHGGPGRRAESRVNYGLHWSNEAWDAGLDWVHGTDLLFRVSARIDPDRVREVPPLRALAPRPAAVMAPEEAIRSALTEAGFRPVSVVIQGVEARIAVAGGRQRRLAGAAGRVARAVQPHLPPQVEVLRISWRQMGVEVARLTLPRRAMEAAGRGDGSAEELFFASTLDAAGGDDLGPDGGGVDWTLRPQLALLLGDPGRTLRWQASAVAGARWEFGRGFALAGSVSRGLAGNLGGAAPSDSPLPHVRSDVGRYARQETAIAALYGERIQGLGPDLFGRVTAGYLEPMFAGVSAELLWRPQNRPWALGVDIAQVVQRDDDQRLGVLGYQVTTGHVSAYADLPWYNLYGVARAGRYLAGDWGGTVELGRRFASGIEIGGFATLTDAPERRLGAAGFDHGVFIRIPLDLLGAATRAVLPVVLRGAARDGGQRLAVDNPLWDVTREGTARAFREGVGDFLR